MKERQLPLFTEEAGRRDAAWVAATLAGNMAAFDALVRAYERPAVATAYRLLNRSDEAQDVVQEACLRAYRSLVRLQDPTRFGPWLLRIVRNLALNARRARTTRGGRTVALDEQLGTGGMTDGGGEPIVADPGPERRAAGHELQIALDAALAQLPEKQRQALLLFTVECLPQKEIAEKLACSLEAVKWNVFQARKRLREMLGDQMME